MKLWLKCVIVLFLITMAGYLADRLLRHEGVPRRDLLLLSDFLIGALAAVLVFALGRQSEQRSKLVSARLKVIAEMNHHTRNALQVIAYHSTLGKDEKEIAVIRQPWTASPGRCKRCCHKFPTSKTRPCRWKRAATREDRVATSRVKQDDLGGKDFVLFQSGLYKLRSLPTMNGAKTSSTMAIHMSPPRTGL